MLENFKKIFLLEDHTRYNALDSIRGLAALLVFFVHFNGFQAAQNSGYLSLWYPFRQFGTSIGVDIFFVLSGYLIYTICYKSNIKSQQFIIQRHRRLLLVNAFVLFISAQHYTGYIGLLCYALPILFVLQVIQYRVHETLQQKIYAFLNKLLLMFFATMLCRQLIYQLPIDHTLNYFLNLSCFHIFFKNAHALNHVQWALCIEYFFYYLFAFRLLYFSASKLSYYTLVIIGILILVLPSGLEYRGVCFPQIFRMIGFMFGMGLAKLLCAHKINSKIVNGIGLSALVIGLPVFLHVNFTFWASSPKLVVVIVDIASVFIIWSAVSHGSLCSRLLNHIFLRFIGKISFSFYLIHQHMINISWGYIYFKKPPFIKLYLHFGLAIFSAITFSSLMFYFLERPYFLRHKTREKTPLLVAKEGIAS